MNDWPIGLSTGCFYRIPICDCLEKIRAAGFSMIEICSFPAHLDYHDVDAVKRAGQLIDQLGLEAYSFHAPFAEHIDITSPDAQFRDSSTQEILQAAEAAAAVGAQFLVIHPGPEKGGFPEDQRWRRMESAAAVLNQVSERCRDLRIGLVLENMLPHLFFGHTRDMLWILGSLETVDIGICLDTGHAHLSGDLATVVHKLSGHLRMVHASDNRGKFDDHLPPGEGRIAWDRFMDQLAQLRFDGSFILEIAGDSDTETVLESARRGRRFLRNLSRRPGRSPP
jgi:sugar phosphate isomerase/epimerase